MWNLMPTETKFFTLFDESAANVLAGARLLQDMVVAYENVPDKAKKLFACEHHGDKITQRILTELTRTFVTPIDREDIQLLAQGLDDVLDFIEETGDFLDLYNIQAPTPGLVEQVEVLVRATEVLTSLVANLSNMRNARSFEEYQVKLHEIENEGDRVTRREISSLFRSGSDPIELIKWKDIYEDVENAIDKCEDVGNIVHTIVLKYA